VSNHRGRVSNFDKNGETEAISIVIESQPKGRLINDGKAHVVEFKYRKKDLDNANGNPYVQIIDSISEALQTGVYEDKTGGLAKRIEANGSEDVENTSLRLAEDDDIFAQAQRIADEEERKRRSGNDTNTTDPNPTQAQKEAGNYKKKHLKVDGYDISIENERGSMRSGVDKDGAKWEQKMHNDYGYIRGTEGVDGDHIDLFLSDHYEKSGDVYVIDQVNKDGSFDEHKVMCGFDSEKEARDAYLSNYEKGWTGLGAITRVSRDDFKKWVDSSHRKTKPFAEYASVKRSLADDDDINFRIDEEDDNSEPSRRMGLANRISAAATEMSQNHQDNVNMRSQALAAIGRSLDAIGKATQAQRRYDVATMGAVADLARTLIESHLIDNVNRTEMKSLLTIVRDSIGKIAHDKQVPGSKVDDMVN
jgi:hypothetical protein